MQNYKKLKFCPQCGGLLSKKNIEHIKRLKCSSCGYILYNNPIPGVDAVIITDNKLLLTKRAFEPNANFWDLPGGFVELNETLESALKRELKEELNIESEIGEVVGVLSTSYGKDQGAVSILFSVKANLDNFKIGSDIKEARMFDFNKLPKNIVSPKRIQLIKKWRKKHGR